MEQDGTSKYWNVLFPLKNAWHITLWQNLSWNNAETNQGIGARTAAWSSGGYRCSFYIQKTLVACGGFKPPKYRDVMGRVGVSPSLPLHLHPRPNLQTLQCMEGIKAATLKADLRSASNIWQLMQLHRIASFSFLFNPSLSLSLSLRVQVCKYDSQRLSSVRWHRFKRCWLSFLTNWLLHDFTRHFMTFLIRALSFVLVCRKHKWPMKLCNLVLECSLAAAATCSWRN